MRPLLLIHPLLAPLAGDTSLLVHYEVTLCREGCIWGGLTMCIWLDYIKMGPPNGMEFLGLSFVIEE